MPTEIDPVVLRTLLRYDSESGGLYWRHRSPEFFSDSTRAHHVSTWNSKHADRAAFSAINRDGYKTGTVLGETHLAHRVTWALEQGSWPVHQLDHIDGDRLNNRIHNLREATSVENNRNTTSRCNASSKFLGVSWQKKCKKWKSTIRINGIITHLGLFLDETDAAMAYDAAASRCHGSFARLNFPMPAIQFT